MIALIFVIALVLLFPLFFPGYYVSELLLSFLPYLAGITGLISLVSLVCFRKKMKSWQSLHLRYFRGFSLLVFWFLFLWYSKQFNHFYSTEPFDDTYSSWSLTVLYANIHKDNVEYSGIEQLISDTDPDILMFVEFADHHYIHLKDFLKTRYPYTNNTTRSKTFIWSMVFSKYPINNKADDFPQGAWRYGYFSIPYQGQDMYFYLVHTSSPDSYKHFVMRNDQLRTFVHDFTIHESDRKHDNIIVVGDFNITPRSSYYSVFTQVFSGKLFNVTCRIPFLFTWTLKEFPLLSAHIDHFRTTSSFVVSSLHSMDIPWSDHKGFLTTLQLK